MIVDFHTHIFPPGVVKDRDTYLGDGNFSLLYATKKSRMADHETLLRAMDEAGVDRAVAMGFPWREDGYARMHNDYQQEAALKSGGRILPFASVSVAGDDEIDGFAAGTKGAGFSGIGEMAFYSRGMDEQALKRLKAVLRAAVAHELPVCLHVNEPIGHTYAGKYEPGLMGLFGVLSDFRDATVILSHWGGGLIFYELMPSVSSVFGNVYYDTAASPYIYDDRVYKVGVRIAGSEKILFGSDFPLLKFSRYIEAIGELGLSDVDVRNIMGENALRILGLRGDVR
jgi:predicted TIM-barrel fold metal-dependent hydrolase